LRRLERVLARGLFDPIEEGLPKLGQRELGLNFCDVDRRDGLLHAPYDRDLADLEHTLLLLDGSLRLVVGSGEA